MKLRKITLAIPAVLAMVLVISSAWAAMDSSGSIIQIQELDQAKVVIKEGKYRIAIKLLTEANSKVPNHADVMNLLGYSLRKLGKFKKAEVFYQRALKISPQHLGALEYMGELYLETGRPQKAKELLARLRKACVLGCEELEDLEKAVKKFESNKR